MRLIFIGKIIDLTGKNFGRLTVLKMSDIYKCNRIYWDCVCECGNHVTIAGGSLKSGLTKSCGCLQRDAISNIAIKRRLTNEYNIENGTYVLTIGRVHEVLFDEEYFDIIAKSHWSYHHSGYCYTKIDGKLILMHRLLTNATSDQFVDHINRNKLDNRIQNLRFCTKAQNSANMSTKSSNKSGVSGVYYCKANKNWVAMIRAEGERKFLGGFTDINDAIRARLQAEKKYFVDFAPQKDLYEKYNI